MQHYANLCKLGLNGISSQVHSTGLCHLSALFKAFRNYNIHHRSATLLLLLDGAGDFSGCASIQVGSTPVLKASITSVATCFAPIYDENTASSSEWSSVPHCSLLRPAGPGHAPPCESLNIDTLASDGATLDAVTVAVRGTLEFLRRQSAALRATDSIFAADFW